MEAVFHYICSFWAFLYGLIIGSFLNVCIYRLPPKLFFFEDLLQKEESDFTYYFDRLLVFLRIRQEDTPEIQQVLYAEGVIFVTLHPESIVNSALSQAYNLFRMAVPDRVNIVHPRSFCPNCRNMIRWWMNIPLLSYIILGGKCYYCKKKISARYPFMELLTGILFALAYYFIAPVSFIAFLYYAVLIGICIVVFNIDLEHWLILDEITLPFTLMGILGALFVPFRFFEPPADIMNIFVAGYQTGILADPHQWIFPQSLVQSLIGAMMGGLAFWAVSVIGRVILKRDAMGGGDIKFAILMGAFLGPFKAFSAFFLAVLLGTLIMLPLLIIRRKTGKDQVPFGCFLTIATVITIFLGDRLIWLFLNWPALLYR